MGSKPINKTVQVHVADATGVAERWRGQYQRENDWADVVGGSGKDIYDRLCALGQEPNVEEVAAIIGNKSWSHISCASCRDYVVKAVLIENWESPVFVCESCIAAALKAIRE